MEIYSDHNFGEAIQLARQGKYLHALQILKKLYEEHHEDNLLLLKIAEIYEQLGNIDSVINLLDEINPINLSDEYLLQFSQMFIRNSRFDKASDLISIVDKTIFPEAIYLKGQANFSNNEFEIALINFSEFIKNGKDSDLLGEAYQYAAECCLILKDYEKALKYAEKAEKLTSLNPDLYFVLAKIYYMKEMHFHAKDYIYKAIKMNENVVEYKELAGRILYKTGDYDKAENYLKASAVINENNSETLSLIGFSCLKQKKNEEAARFFSKSLELNPDDLLAKNGIAECKI